MTDQHTTGFYAKYFVARNDGRDQPGGDRAGAQYLVLDLTYDEHARMAAWEYASGVESEYPQLAEDLRTLLTKLQDDQDARGQA